MGNESEERKRDDVLVWEVSEFGRQPSAGQTLVARKGSATNNDKMDLEISSLR